MAAEMFCIISLIVITEIRKIFIIELSEKLNYVAYIMSHEIKQIKTTLVLLICFY